MLEFISLRGIQGHSIDSILPPAVLGFIQLHEERVFGFVLVVEVEQLEIQIISVDGLEVGLGGLEETLVYLELVRLVPLGANDLLVFLDLFLEVSVLLGQRSHLILLFLYEDFENRLENQEVVLLVQFGLHADLRLLEEFE